MQAAQKANSFIVMDEAYGDYMDDDQTALSLVPEFDNLAVVRTFSKGFGAAGVRLEYRIAQPQIMAAFHKVNIPFSKNSLADAFAIQAMQARWAQKTLERVKQDKPKLLAALAECEHLHVAHTSPGVSISSVLYVDDEQIIWKKYYRMLECAW